MVQVAEYARLNFWEALNLPCDLFMLCRKNAIMSKLEQTEEGRQYLADCERYKQTRMDLAGLRTLLGKINKTE